MDKKALRKLAQMKRHELPPLLKAQFDENIRSQLMKVQEPYQKIGMYISINDEADTRRILQHLLDQGKQIAVPKCVVREGRNTLDFYWIEGLEDCIPSRFELLEPVAQPSRKAALSELELIYEIPRKTYEKNLRKTSSIDEELYQIEHVQYVNIVAQDDDISS